jgi:hypothetical protein
MAEGRLTPTVVTAHGPVHNDANGDFYRALGDTVQLVAISDAQRASASDLAWSATVHNAIRAETFPFRADKDEYALFLGGSIRTNHRTWPSTRPGRLVCRSCW